MQLLGLTIDIHQQQVIQQQVLDEVITVEPLLVSHDQVLQLTDRHLAYHIGIVAAAFGNQDVCKDSLIIDFEKMAALKVLPFRRRLHKAPGHLLGYA